MTDEMMNTVRKAIKNWWIPLIVGILGIVLGIWCLITPDKSLVAMTYVFVIAFFIGGVLDICFAVSNRKYIYGWGWTLTAGILETLLGIMLLALPAPQLTSILVYVVGFWILFRSIWGMGESFQIHMMRVRGWGWLLALSILCVVLSFLFLISPAFGGMFLVIFIGTALIFYGIFRIVLAFGLRSIGKEIKGIR